MPVLEFNSIPIHRVSTWNWRDSYQLFDKPGSQIALGLLGCSELG
jgi:hypothetical protein